MTNKQLAEAIFKRGSNKERKGEYSAALVSHIRAAQLQPSNIKYINAAGIAARTLGEYKTATKYFKRVVAIRDMKLGKGHPLTKQAQSDLDRVIIDALEAGGK
ncbi:MAG: hypothetical protein GY820_32110 [Gammaproteobacteria bacterium]|nr:hypothetical protein [Gammaproteobacteria bacterium]